jgi:hemerythrin-like domain-containing protein
MKSTKLLLADHEIILQALHVLDAINTDIQSGKEVMREDIRSLVTFLREFTDGSHHVKEEAIFFPALIQAGMDAGEGPLFVMNYEHERGRSLIAAMENAIVGNDIESSARRICRDCCACHILGPWIHSALASCIGVCMVLFG